MLNTMTKRTILSAILLSSMLLAEHSVSADEISIDQPATSIEVIANPVTEEANPITEEDETTKVEVPETTPIETPEQSTDEAIPVVIEQPVEPVEPVESDDDYVHPTDPAIDDAPVEDQINEPADQVNLEIANDTSAISTIIPADLIVNESDFQNDALNQEIEKISQSDYTPSDNPAMKENNLAAKQISTIKSKDKSIADRAETYVAYPALAEKVVKKKNASAVKADKIRSSIFGNSSYSNNAIRLKGITAIAFTFSLASFVFLRKRKLR